MDYTKISSTKLYLMRSQDPAGIDRELDRRNGEAASKVKPRRRNKKYRMADYREQDYWCITDNGQLLTGEKAVNYVQQSKPEKQS